MSLYIRANDAYNNGQIGLKFTAGQTRMVTNDQFRALFQDRPGNFEILAYMQNTALIVSQAALGQPTIVVDEAHPFFQGALSGELWATIDAFGDTPEIREVTNIASDGKTWTLASNLSSTHPTGTLVIWTDIPVFGYGLDQADRRFGYGTTGTGPNYPFDVYKARTDAANNTRWLASVWHDLTTSGAVTSADHQALHVTLNYTTNNAVSGSYLVAAHGNLEVNGSGNIGPQMIAGVWGTVSYNGSGTSIDHMMGVRGEVTADAGSGIKMSALYAASPVIEAVGAVDQVFGVYIEDQFDSTQSATTVYNLYSEGLAALGVEGSIEFIERTDPVAPPANRVYLYAKDNGSGKTQIVARFATGAVQVIATEPP